MLFLAIICWTLDFMIKKIETHRKACLKFSRNSLFAVAPEYVCILKYFCFSVLLLLPCSRSKKRQISHLRLLIQSTLVGQDGDMLMEKRYHLFTNTSFN